MSERKVVEINQSGEIRQLEETLSKIVVWHDMKTWIVLGAMAVSFGYTGLLCRVEVGYVTLAGTPTIFLKRQDYREIVKKIANRLSEVMDTDVYLHT